jgi:putative membrane protein
MGMANLVPGISGGTMLVAAGVYTRFIDAVSEVSRLRFRPESLWILGCVVFGALAAIGALSGLIATALVEARWIMYSLFIGLTLGGAPLLYKMIRPLSLAPVLAAGLGIIIMLAIVWVQQSGANSAGAAQGPLLLALAGAAAASAMILPGISGAYLLLLLGAYETVIDAIKNFMRAAVALDIQGAMSQVPVLLPIGIGVLVGVVGVSNVLRVVLHRYERATIGFLLGLLLAAPAGLYPFVESIPPSVGDTIKGAVVTAESLPDVKPKDWAVRSFQPGPGHFAGAGALVVVGIAATLGVARLGKSKD